MPKATLEFDLNDADDYMAHKRMMKSDDMASAIWNIVHNTKKSLEWSMEGQELDKYDALYMVFDKIHEILEEHNVKIDEIYN